MTYTEEMTTSEILLRLASMRNELLQAVNDIEKISKNICYKAEQKDLLVTEYPQDGEVNLIGRDKTEAVVMAYDVYKELTEPQTETQTETQTSNKNSNVISVYDGVSEAVRCAMCSNPNKSDRGCDGACSYDEKLYERIMKAITESIVKTEPQYDIDKGTIKCDNCSENGSYKCSKCDGEMYFKRIEIEDEPQTDCSWK